MAANDHSNGADQPTFYTNQQLFSDYYLKERMAGHREWSEESENLKAAFDKAMAIYREAKASLTNANEAQTEDDFIKPIFSEVLGLYFDVQPTATRQGKRNRPDYALFTTEEKARAAKQVRDDEGKYYAQTQLVADAKYWGRPLDTAGDAGREELSNANPSFQIVNYLVATGAEWGVLTNGTQWRLYAARARSRVDTYYEVDLAAILEAGDLEAFRYFYFFFRAEAFQRDPHTGQTFLEAVHEGSVNYGVSLQQRLKGLIFDEVFLLLAAGFLEEMDIEDPDQDLLDEVYQGTLRLLYRMLFLLHAESRDLLPVNEEAYYGYSLLGLQRTVAGEMDQGKTLSRVSTDLWNDLDSLFRIIDEGDPDINVPRYNGGLFRKDEPRNAFLESHAIPDKYLYPALLLLTREEDPESGQKRFIDYKDLDVEQLGSIYEGLLEFHLRRDPEEFTELKESGVNTQLSLLNDKGERKATGSYYTPHYIVEYIVDNTLGPVLAEREKEFRSLMGEISPRRERLADVEEKLAEDPDRADGAVTRWENERTSLKRELADLEGQALEAVLGVRVCDPAMGSGHFLVEAADWLAEHLIALLNEFPDNPVQRRLSEIRERILGELEEGGISIPREKLKDTNLLKRMVMKRCIYGVDLNPMAVELAKLSLWLDSFTVGAPLSFLDHHLKVGNSLIGTRVEDVREALESEDSGQIHMFGGPFAGLLTATGLMRDVALRTDATFTEVTESAEKYQAFEEAMLPYKRVLDLWVSRHFGNERAEDLLRDPGVDALGAVVEEMEDLDAGYREAIRQGQALWEEKRFFHWELEFPEAFIDLERSDWKKNPGFDTVIGNPPYVSVRDLIDIAPEERQYFNESNIYECAQHVWDLYMLMSEKGFSLLSNRGFCSFIVPVMFLHQQNAEKLRELFITKGWIKQVIDLSNIEVFRDAIVKTSIFIVKKTSKKNIGDRHVKIFKPKSEKEFGSEDSLLYRENLDVLSNRSEVIFHTQLTPDVIKIIEKIKNQSILLKEILYPTFGLRPSPKEKGGGTKDRLLVAEKKSSEAKPYIEGRDVSRFLVSWKGRYVLYRPDEMYSARFPELFENKKILVRAVLSGKELVSTVDEDKYYADQTLVCCVKPKAVKNHIEIDHIESSEYDFHFLVSQINSKLESFYFSHILISDSLGGGAIHCTPGTTGKLPIKSISFSTSADLRSDLLENAKSTYNRFIDSGKSGSMLQLINNHIAQTPPRDDVAHDILNYLAIQMRIMLQMKHELHQSRDIFKYLNKSVDFSSVAEVFSEEVKYSERILDLSAVHHDLDGLRLVPLEDGETWELQAQLKLRDPEQDWQEWQYEEGGNYIKREWTPVYRFREMNEDKARYYQFALPVRDEFTNAGSLPGGYTRSTQKKLELAEIPAYDPDLDLTPLVELTEELAGVERRIALTDNLIDQIVYKLYGLTEEEIAIVEGKA